VGYYVRLNHHSGGISVKKLHLTAAICALAAASASAPLYADGHGHAGDETTYSPYAGREHPTRVWWGDTHLHTSMSMDAGAFGNRLGVREAYYFARGGEVKASGGQPARLSRPLDFLVVADHSDNMGFFPDLYAGKEELLEHPKAQEWYDRIQAGGGVEVAMELIGLFSQGNVPDGLFYTPDTQPFRDAWELTVAAAEEFNDPGQFTAFIGYEWTSLVRGGNMHRVVIYRDGADVVGDTVPFVADKGGSIDPMDLWKWLERYEASQGGDVLAIAHNGNLSNGIMFPNEAAWNGRKLDELYVTERIKWEPLYEITQIKGDGETHPFLSPDDEFADYENWAFGNLDLSEKKTDDMLAAEYGREALKRGLQLEDRLGTNPYKFGLIGSTDSHTTLATAKEDNFFGKHAGYEPGPGRMTHPFFDTENGTIYGWAQVSSGLAAVWSKENTRESLFDAMERKEVYGTTGSRMTVRVFGGWDFTAADLKQEDPSEAGYARGVPMGGDLAGAGDGASPSFMVYASRDPDGGNLDRIQVVKGWVDSAGEAQEKVYDVAWSGNRSPGANGKLPAIADTVDPASATWDNRTGAPDLATVWTDPDFDASQDAFYYVRVIEIPTPRWTTYESVRFGLPIPDGAPVSTQERAYTSPIWYSAD
jgi:hypothetical protein